MGIEVDVTEEHLARQLQVETSGPTGKRTCYRLLRGDGTYVSIYFSGYESSGEQGHRCLSLFYYLDTAEAE